MNKVYIVLDEIAYEGSRVEAVFRSLDAAHEFCRSQTRLLLPDNGLQSYSIDPDYQWLVIESWEVK